MFNLVVDIYEIRRLNSRILMLSLDGGISAMAEKINKPQDLVSRWLGDVKSHKNMGKNAAREIERVFGKPHGWLDQIHQTELKQTHQGTDDRSEARESGLPQIREAPIVGQLIMKNGVVMLREIRIGTIEVYSDDMEVRCYQDDTGEYEPRIRINDVIVVEPGHPFATEDDVLICLKNGSAMIKQYISEDSEYYRVDDINHQAPRSRILKSEIETIESIGGNYPRRKIREHQKQD